MPKNQHRKIVKARVAKEQNDIIKLIWDVTEENAKQLHPQIAASLKEDVKSFIPRIMKNWENDEMVDKLINAIRYQYIKWQWINAIKESTNE